MIQSRAMASAMVFFFLAFCLGTSAEADLISNGGFSGGLAGWSTSGNVSAVDFAHLPSAYKSTWDLSAWNSRLTGGFALIEGRGQLFTSVFSIDTIPSSLSLDYAVAWQNLNSPSKSTDYGYFYCQIDGRTADNRLLPLLYKEIDWIGQPSQGVATGSFFADNFIQDSGQAYTEILFSLNVFNPYQFNQIIGIDNLTLSAAAPVPEPATLLILGSGLVGFAGLFRKKLKR